MCMSVCRHTHATVQMKTSEDDLQELDLYFHSVSPRGQTHSVDPCLTFFSSSVCQMLKTR